LRILKFPHNFKEAPNKIVEIACLDGPDGHSDWVRDVAFCPRPDPTETILVSASEVYLYFEFGNSNPPNRRMVQ